MAKALPQSRGGRPAGRIVFPILLPSLLGLLPLLPALLHGSPILNNDMLVAYFCYFWDFHRNWSWSHPLVFWSSSYQCGMPMHAYWQSGYLYPVTWLLFGPLSPHIGIHLFYAFHFALGIAGFLKAGPALGLHRPAALWAGICFSLSGTMLARYEHATFLAGWAWMPWVLAAFLALRDRPGPKPFFAYAAAAALQALGGHPQASVTTALLLSAFTIPSLLRGIGPSGGRSGHPGSRVGSGNRIAWILGGHLLALAYCTPMLLPFLHLVGQTDRFDGVAWEGGQPGEGALAAQSNAASQASASEKLEAGVFAFEKFATGGFRPVHFLSLAAPNALGSPSNASWWGGEVWGEVFVYLGGLGLCFCLFASPRRAKRDLRLLWLVGLFGLWLAFGAHLGASQILYHVPVLNNFRRPARFLILFALAMAALSGHGLQAWLGRPRASRAAAWFSLAALGAAAGLASFRGFPGLFQGALAWVSALGKLDPAKDYAGKVAALLGRGAVDGLFLSLSAGAVWFAARVLRDPGPAVRRRRGPVLALLFLVLLADLLRVHWDHFYLFPSGFYRHPPLTTGVLDKATEPFWRVSHYLEYPGLEMWEMHNDPLAHFHLIDREKSALSCGIHAVFGYRHVGAHLPLMWKWDRDLTAAGKSARYLFTNADLGSYQGDSLSLLGRFGSVNAYEFEHWRPRLEMHSHAEEDKALPGEGAGAETREARNRTACPSGYSGYGGLCVKEDRDGEIQVKGNFRPGDTLLVRERFHPEWKYRIDGQAWRYPLETKDHFLDIPLPASARSVELRYSPRLFYQASGLCLFLTLALAGFFRLRKKT